MTTASLAQEQLWVPGRELLVSMETPTPEQLCTVFAQHVALDREVFQLNHSLGVATVPDRPITGFAFIDIDDTIGDLSGSLQALAYGDVTPTLQRANNHDYGEKMFFDDSNTALKFPLYALIRACEAGQRPVADLGKIARTVMSWRAAGIYTGFVSALTPGSELPAVQNFIGRYFQGNCDFMVVCSGDYRLADKGTAAQAVLQTIGYDKETPVAVIDDWSSHLAKVRNAVTAMPGSPRIETFQYVFPSHIAPDGGSQSANTAIGTFDLATDFFARQLNRQAVELS